MMIRYKKMETKGKPLKEITDFIISRYLQDMEALNILRLILSQKLLTLLML